MRHSRKAMGGVVGVMLLSATFARGDTTPDPLRFVPKQAGLVAKIENPKQLIKSLYYLDVVQKAMEIDAVREIYNSTNAQRFYQLISHFERKLGKNRFELLDELGGGGAVLAMKLSQKPTVLAILQGKNEKLLHQFVDASMEVVKNELERQQVKAKPQLKKYRGVTVYALGKEVNFGVAGSALLFSNDRKGVKAAIDLYRDGDAKSIVHSKSLHKAQRELSDTKPAGWLWLDLQAFRKLPGVEQGLNVLEIDPFQTFFYGGIVSVVKRAPYLTVGFYHSENQLRTRIRMPAGRNGMAKKLSYIIPKKGGVLPPLAPKDALLSTSFYIDWNEIWNHRHEVLPDDLAKGLEKLQEKAGVVLGGTKFSELLAQVGPHQRVVVAYTTSAKYKTKPAAPILPSFALVTDMRDPQFAKHMDGILRATALLGAFKYKLKIEETKYKGEHLVSYYFPENGKVQDQYLYNFSPSFAKVGDQFMVSSTAELARALIDELVNKRDEKELPVASTQIRIFASGAASLLRSTKNQVLTQFILDQGLSPSEANKQFETMLGVARNLGVFQLQVDYAPNSFQYDIRLDLGEMK